MARIFRAAPSLIGYAALTIILTAGAAQSLSGSNTVFTDDIVDGAVTTPDIRANAVTSSRIITGGVFSSDVADGSLTIADIAHVSGSNAFDFASIPAESCDTRSIPTGSAVTGKVILITPSEKFDDDQVAGKRLTATAIHSNVDNFFVLVVCNPTDIAIDPVATTFDWVIFDN
jgi:hypothetical protein